MYASTKHSNPNAGHIIPSNHRSNKDTHCTDLNSRIVGSYCAKAFNKLRAIGISSRVGYSATSIGRRYAHVMTSSVLHSASHRLSYVFITFHIAEKGS
jgi:hypothetical protein